MRPPKYWRALDVANDGDVDAMVEVQYGDGLGSHKPVLESHVVHAHDHWISPEEEYDEGSWTSVAPVQNVVVNCMQGDKLLSSTLFDAHPTALESVHDMHLGCGKDGTVSAKF